MASVKKTVFPNWLVISPALEACTDKKQKGDEPPHCVCAGRCPQCLSHGSWFSGLKTENYSPSSLRTPPAPSHRMTPFSLSSHVSQFPLISLYIHLNTSSVSLGTPEKYDHWPSWPAWLGSESLPWVCLWGCSGDEESRGDQPWTWAGGRE